MNSRIFWIKCDKLKGLAIMARPRAGEWLEEEVCNYKREGVDIVISLLEPHEIEELNLQHERRCCEAAGIMFQTFPIADRGTPDSIFDTKRFLEQITTLAKQNKKIAIHCRAGIGRASMMAAGLLLHFGLNTDSAFKLLAESRGVEVPDTKEQREWIRNYEKTAINNSI